MLTSINLEYIAEQQEFVRGVLGKTQAETVPQDFIDRADEVVVVDAPPEADTADRGAAALAAPAAGAAAHGRRRRPPARGLPAAARHPVVVGHAGAHPRLHDAAGERRQMLASGRRNADRFHGELFADLRDARRT